VNVGRTLKSYLFWTYERGSFHYDVMVTLILAFIFLSPRIWNYRDHPAAAGRPLTEIGVQAAAGSFIYEIPASQVHADNSAPFQAALQQLITPISGPVLIDRWEPVKDSRGRLTAWRVWAHRQAAPA
jgi:hypothetical protein